MNASRGLTAWLCLALALSTAAARAERAITVYTENDKYFAGTDRHYTNGFKLSFTAVAPHAVIESFGRQLDDLGQWLAVLEPDRPAGATPPVPRLSFSLGQNIYTPTNIRRTVPDPADRPYAGWLYAGFAFHRQEPDQLQVIEFEFGIVGPGALGRQVQNGWHDVIGVEHAQGWPHQLRNEPGASLTYDWRHRWLHSQESASSGGAGFDVDLIPRWGVSLGNVRTCLAAGALLRGGWNLPADFGPDLIRSAAGGTVQTRGASCFVFGTVEGRAVARDVFLDGNTFVAGPSVAKRPFVADFSAGLALYLRNVHLAYTQNYRTREFHGQPQRDVFGSVSLSVVW